MTCFNKWASAGMPYTDGAESTGGELGSTVSTVDERIRGSTKRVDRLRPNNGRPGDESTHDTPAPPGQAGPSGRVGAFDKAQNWNGNQCSPLVAESFQHTYDNEHDENDHAAFEKETEN